MDFFQLQSNSFSSVDLSQVRCKPGEERQLVRSILMKQFSAKMAGEALKLKSAFCTGAKGYIYVEALAEPLAKEALSGLRGIFWSSKDDVPAFSKVPINQMTSLLNVKVTKRPLKNNQFVRIKRGPLKGDLAKVVYVYEGSSKAVIQAVPRPDYTKEKSTKLAGSDIYKHKRTYTHTHTSGHFYILECRFRNKLCDMHDHTTILHTLYVSC